MSVRKIFNLIAGLSADSALVSTMNKGWSNLHELVAIVAETVDVGNLQNLLANGVRRSELPEQIQIKRPWMTDKPKRQATPEETIELFRDGLYRGGEN